jgi:hypothetical protein
VTAPLHPPGKVSVTVEVNGVVSNRASFEYLAASAGDYFPTAGKQYHYKVTSSTGSFSFYTKLLNQKDSAGLKVVTIASYLPATTVFAYAYKSSAETVYQLNAPPQTLAIMKTLSRQPDYISGVLEGFPVSQHMSNVPLVNEPVNFIGGPIHMRIRLNSHMPSIPYLQNDFMQYYNTGKVLAYETVTTPAGTFPDCMKWEYNSKTVSETTLTGTTIQNFHKVIWFAKGIGPVKDYEDGPEGRTISQLVSVN